jgi:hypothetical protein
MGLWPCMRTLMLRSCRAALARSLACTVPCLFLSSCTNNDQSQATSISPVLRERTLSIWAMTRRSTSWSGCLYGVMKISSPRSVLSRFIAYLIDGHNIYIQQGNGNFSDLAELVRIIHNASNATFQQELETVFDAEMFVRCQFIFRCIT